ncbi:MAG: class II fructose-bisphosphatase [Deltaproteobacteria bacterium]|nr:class II fructose-bisphosphatase [Deltaproteobacteria bacterium]
MERNLALDLLRATEAASLASARLMGRGDKHAAEQAATVGMHNVFRSIDLRARVVIGAGERLETPVLFVGEEVGRWSATDAEADVAAIPLDGAKPCAYGGPNAICVMAMTLSGRFLPVPDVYMEKMVVGPAGKGALDIHRPVTANLQAVADAKGLYVEDLTVVILDRPRHEALIREVREAGARIKLIGDGDVAGAISSCLDETGVDMLLGIGGAHEGVIAAAALLCTGGDMVARLRPRNVEDLARLKAAGFDDPDRVYGLHDLVTGDVFFAATGVTDGDFLKGVRFIRGGAVTRSLVMRSRTMTVRQIETHHRFDRTPDYS